MRRFGAAAALIAANALASFAFLLFNGLLWPLLWWRWPAAQVTTNYGLSTFTLLVDVFFLIRQRWQSEEAERHTAAQAETLRALTALVQAIEQRLPPKP